MNTKKQKTIESFYAKNNFIARVRLYLIFKFKKAQEKLFRGLIFIATSLFAIGKELCDRVYLFFLKTKSNPNILYRNGVISIILPLEYKKQKEFIIYDVDILKYYHKKGNFYRETQEYSVKRFKINKNTLNESKKVHYFEYLITPIDILKFKTGEQVFIDVSFKELNGISINKTYNLSNVLKNNKQVFNLIVNRQKELINKDSSLGEEEKNKQDKKINPDIEEQKNDWKEKIQPNFD